METLPKKSLIPASPYVLCCIMTQLYTNEPLHRCEVPLSTGLALLAGLWALMLQQSSWLAHSCVCGPFPFIELPSCILCSLDHEDGATVLSQEESLQTHFAPIDASHFQNQNKLKVNASKLNSVKTKLSLAEYSPANRPTIKTLQLVSLKHVILTSKYLF